MGIKNAAFDYVEKIDTSTGYFECLFFSHENF